jgi:hypothetical protein
VVEPRFFLPVLFLLILPFFLNFIVRHKYFKFDLKYVSFFMPIPEFHGRAIYR